MIHEINTLISTAARIRRTLSVIDDRLADATAAFENGHVETARDLINLAKTDLANLE